MRLEQQYQELLRLRKEINIRLNQGTDFQNIKDLALFLAKDSGYQKLKRKENQMIFLDCFLSIWLEEKRKLLQLGIEEDIFTGTGSLEKLEQRYQRIKYCGLRIENHVPEPYISQSISWLIDQKISGIAIGKIVVFETKDREDNLLHIAQEFKRRGELTNAVLLLQYAREKYPKQDSLALEEADCWIQGQQWERAHELLTEIERPTEGIRETIIELERVMGHG
ncbi:MAG: hypothetical protein K2O34_05600 [Acetatifactor sp.]|nr:hypothetical protein [Acetatifactor sp.]